MVRHGMQHWPCAGADGACSVELLLRAELLMGRLTGTEVDNILAKAAAIGPVRLATAGRRAAALGKALVVMETVDHHTVHGPRPGLDRVYVHTHSTQVAGAAEPADTAEEQELVLLLSLAAQRARDGDGDTVLALLTRADDDDG
eukprot:2403706-Prymnesium_polylepis.1